MDTGLRPHDDDTVTLRAPRWSVALVIAVAVHVAVVVVASSLPEVKRKTKPVEITMMSSPKSTSAPAPAPAPQQQRARKRASPPPSTSPVLPELPPSDDDRPELPVAEKSPQPAPPPAPSSWKDSLKQQLAATRGTARQPTGVLAPSPGTLERVAASDPRMYDEHTERRMAEDFGPFFRRGLEALRANWHPDQVLNVTERDPSRRCGRRNRTTFAVAVLDKQGNVVDVDLKNPSGCEELDAEAVAAFKRVASFPHPPKGIFVAPDGTETDTARYPVRFIVTFDGGIRLDWHG